jgi:hypothetical protein
VVKVVFGKDEWYTEPDDTKKSWCFLVLKNEDWWIREWKIGYGNPIQFLEVESELVETAEHEKHLLIKLMKELEEAKKECSTLITKNEGDLRRLRTRLIENGITEFSLRGFRHVCLETVLKNNFENHEEIVKICEENKKEITTGAVLFPRNPNPKSIWNAYTSIGALVPSEAVKGEAI